MFDLFYLLIPELIALVLAKLIGGISIPSFMLMLVCFMFWKSLLTARARTRSRVKQLLIAGTGALYELGAIVSIHTGCCTEKYAFSLMLGGILFGTIAANVTRLLERNLKSRKVVLGTLLAGCCFAVLAALAFRFFGRPINGSYNWLKLNGVSVQLSELYKPMLAVFFAVLTVKFRRIELFYALAALICVLLVAVLKETGTAMVFVVSVLVLGLCFAEREKGKDFSGFCRSVTLPMIGIAVLLVGLHAVYQYSEYKVKHHPDIQLDTELHEFVTTNEECRKAIYLFERTHSCSDQILSARSVLKQAGIVKLQAQYHPFHNAAVKELTSDYNYAVMCSTFGWLIPVVTVGTFVCCLAFMLFLLRKDKTLSGRMAQCCIVLFLAEILFHIGGLFFLPFTGITLPFSSYGGSALVCGSMMIGVIYNSKFECLSEERAKLKALFFRQKKEWEMRARNAAQRRRAGLRRDLLTEPNNRQCYSMKYKEAVRKAFPAGKEVHDHEEDAQPLRIRSGNRADRCVGDGSADRICADRCVGQRNGLSGDQCH